MNNISNLNDLVLFLITFMGLVAFFTDRSVVNTVEPSEELEGSVEIIYEPSNTIYKDNYKIGLGALQELEDAL